MKYTLQWESTADGILRFQGKYSLKKDLSGKIKNQNTEDW